MNPKFEVDFLEDAVEFLESLDEKSRRKIIFNIDKSRYVNDPKLFKKLTKEIWEFRTKYQKNQ
ncbi:MAG: type II toxin-antitoxin system RelE/ParE family toxin, partial [bacterium]|nr:type II toxin-antitoxin system RelE/ParE family toxin [bacterium]